MSTVPSVGIAMVTFNHERFVREAVESILDEGHPADRLQLIVVDNGSTDATPEILRDHTDRAEIHCIEARTVNEAANLGLARFDTDYFTVFSGDDVWVPGRLAHMLEIMERRPEVGLLCGDKEIIDGGGRLLAPSAAQASGIKLPAGPPFGSLIERNLVFGPTMLMRGSLKPALTPIPPQAAWEDWWFAATAARISQVAYTDHVLARYRRHGDNLTAATTPEKQAHLLREEMRFRGWLLQTVAAGEATAQELTAAALKQVDFAVALSKLERRPAERAAGITGAARRAAHAAHRRAQASSDPHEQLIELAHAVGHNPTEPRYGHALSKAAGIVDRGRLDRIAGPVDPSLVVEDARDHVTLAFADELIATPTLLADYTRATGPDATLVVYAPGADVAATADAIMGAFETAGVAEDAIPDAVILPLPDTASTWAALAVRADDLLTAGAASGWPYDGMRAFSPAAAPA